MLLFLNIVQPYQKPKMIERPHQMVIRAKISEFFPNNQLHIVALFVQLLSRLVLLL